MNEKKQVRLKLSLLDRYWLFIDGSFQTFEVFGHFIDCLCLILNKKNKEYKFLEFYG